MTVHVRFWAAAKAAAGVAQETYEPQATLADLIEAMSTRHGESGRLVEVLGRCSYLVDELSPGRRSPHDVPLPQDCVVDVLPPFAGGSEAGAR